MQVSMHFAFGECRESLPKRFLRNGVDSHTGFARRDGAKFLSLQKGLSWRPGGVCVGRPGGFMGTVPFS